MQFFEEHIRKILAKHTKAAPGAFRLEIPPSQEFGNYALPCFSLTKIAKSAPSAIAKDLHEKILPDEIIERTEVKGPYLNFFIRQALFAEKIIQLIQTNEFRRVPRKNNTVMVEFFHANTHKAVHIGHIRNICLGESLSRILEQRGSTVIRVNYQGDIGPHVAKCLYGLLHSKEKPPLRHRGVWLGKVYSRAHELAKDPKVQEELRTINKNLYAGDPKIIKLWKKTRKYCLDDFEELYREFDVKFKRLYFESEVEKHGIELAKHLLAEGIAKESEGAVIVDLKSYGLSVYVLLTKDKHAVYHTKDLALAELKAKEYPRVDLSIHVVGKEQELYFRQLFKTFELINSPMKGKSHHVIYGLVMLPEGKMSSREGTVVLYDDLIQTMLKRASQEVAKRHSWTKKKIEESAKAIAFGALKYSMLSRENNREIIFDWDTALSFEGETGPYIQYAYARICSILRKCKRGAKPNFGLLNSEKELGLLSALAGFPGAVEHAAQNYSPHTVANYAYTVAKAFSEFYTSNRVIQEDKALEAARISLITSTKAVLEESLRLLGITAPQEM